MIMHNRNKTQTTLNSVLETVIQSVLAFITTYVILVFILDNTMAISVSVGISIIQAIRHYLVRRLFTRYTFMVAKEDKDK